MCGMIQRSLRQLQNAVWNKKRRNSGSSIVIVIIAMAMIGIMATTLLWMAYINYMIKVNDIRNKNSFYSAETVMEQIMAGLRNTSSEAVSEAYGEVLSNWDSLETEGNRYSAFATEYLDTLVKLLKDPSKGDGYYRRELLKGFVDTAAWGNVNETAWLAGTDSTNAADVREPVMELVNGNSLYLRNVFVAYQDGDRLSVVSTDICLDVPSVVFTRTGTVENLYEYLLIGNEGITVAEGSGITADGNIFAGTAADNKEKGGITVNKNASLTVDNGSLIISKGDIDVIGPGASFVVHNAADSGSRVYARSIDLQSGTVSLDSRTYVANDLTLSGKGSKATLTKEYYGYGASVGNGMTGNETDQANSSAIIINGQDSKVDMSGLQTLMLAGRAYIGTSTKKAELDQNALAAAAGDETKKNDKAVLMGESIAVKGGQIAYLVPAECLGVYQGTTVIGQNPVSAKQSGEIEVYKEKYGTDFAEVDFTKKVSRLGNQSDPDFEGLCLADFGVNDMSHIRKVSTQYVGGGAESKTLTYYYLVLDKENAAKYFAAYYADELNKESIDNYFKKYVTGGILLGNYAAENTSYTILGNALVSDALNESGVQLLSDYPDVQASLHALTDAQVQAQSAEIGKTYLALTTNLTEDAASVSESQTVFNSVIRQTIETQAEDGTISTQGIGDYLAAHGDTMEFTTDTGLKGIVTSKDYTLSTESHASDVRLIISLGNITIDRNFTGLAIAKGTITIEGGVTHGAATLKRNKQELYKVLNATTGEPDATVTPLTFLVNGTSGVGGSNTPDVKVDAQGNLDIDYAGIVRYANWVKK